jgi:hypothetical protein
MKLILFFALILILASLHVNSFSQCSDAGVCILGKRVCEVIKLKNSFVSVAYSFGKSGTGQPGAYGDDNISYNSFKFEGEVEALKTSKVGFSIPYSFQSGPLGSASGIGDLIVYWTYLVPLKRKGTMGIMIGSKFATGNTNSDDSLPQSYMNGLGSNDLLLGVSYNYENINAAIAYQKPFGRSANYITRLKRGDDLLIRAGYNQTIDKLNVQAEVLTVLRLQESSIQDPLSTSDDFINIDGSNEVQVNLIGQATYSLSQSFDVWGIIAIPLLKRDYNLDGLRRSFTISASVAYLFNLE